jgi:hypothetical protein
MAGLVRDPQRMIERVLEPSPAFGGWGERITEGAIEFFSQTLIRKL